MTTPNNPGPEAPQPPVVDPSAEAQPANEVEIPAAVPVFSGLKKVLLNLGRGTLETGATVTEKAIEHGETHDAVITNNASRHRTLRGFKSPNEMEEDNPLPATPIEYASSFFRDRQARKQRKSRIERHTIAQVHGRQFDKETEVINDPTAPGGTREVTVEVSRVDGTEFREPRREDFPNVYLYRAAVTEYKLAKADVPATWDRTQHPNQRGVGIRTRKVLAKGRDIRHERKIEKIDRKLDKAEAGETVLGKLRTKRLEALAKVSDKFTDWVEQIDNLLERNEDREAMNLANEWIRNNPHVVESQVADREAHEARIPGESNEDRLARIREEVVSEIFDDLVNNPF
jgi:hypothetical protein